MKSLPFPGVGESCSSPEFMASQICILTLYAKIKFSQKFSNLQIKLIFFLPFEYDLEIPQPQISPSYLEKRTIRIYHECEGGKEKSVPRITVWHHEACRVMTNGDP